MSASNEKQIRQELNNSEQTDSKSVQHATKKNNEKHSNILYGTIAVVFVIALIAAIVWRTNIIPKNATAVTIDGEKYTAAEVGFYYQNTYAGAMSSLSYMAGYVGIDPSQPLKNQTINEGAATILPMMGLGEAEEGQTWHDFFINLTVTQMANVQNALKKADAEGYVYPAGVQTQYEDSVASLKTTAAANGISVDTLLQNNFGPLMTEEIYTEQLMRILKFESYLNSYNDSLTYTDSEIEAAYNEDRNTYDKVAYESVSFSGTAESTVDEESNTVEPTEEEIIAAQEAAQQAANALLASAQSGGELEALVEGNEDANYVKNDSGVYSGNVLTEWLFDETRQAGDIAVLESGSTYYVAKFNERYREEYETIDVRHILVPLAAGTLTAADEGYAAEQAQLAADAKAQAEELLAQWQSGEATEDSFAALAMEHSTDSSKYNGGLYTNVAQGEMVTTFNDWCFDVARETGDTGIVETQYGAHVMYFAGKNLPYWQTMVTNTLKIADYQEWEDSLSADSVIERNDLGMNFVL